MNFADLQSTWQSPHNQPTAGELEKQKMDLIRTLHRRDRGFAIGLTLIIAALVGMTAALVRNQWFGGTHDTIDFQREWSAVIFFAVQWLAAIWILVRYRKHLAQQGEYAASIRDTIEALRAQNHFKQLKSRIILGAQLISLPIVALVIYQLQSVGKMRPHEAKSAAFLLSVLLLASITGVLWELKRKLRPEQQRLEALRAEYDNQPSASA